MHKHKVCEDGKVEYITSAQKLENAKEMLSTGQITDKHYAAISANLGGEEVIVETRSHHKKK